MKKFSPHQLTANVKLLHKVAFVCQDQVLILKRAQQSFSRPGKWDLPGGNSDWPSQEQQDQLNLHQHDIVRELQEETGLEIQPDQFQRQNLIYFATYFEADRQIYSINCGWKVEILSSKLPTIKISPEHTEFAWIKLDELNSYDFGGPNRDFETQIISQALNSSLC